jgi:PAS domain S-box-containing protein
VQVDVGGKIAFVNKMGASIMGASDPRDLIGRSVFEIIHPDYHNIVKDRIRTMNDTGCAMALIEEKYIRLDGRVVDVDVWAMGFRYEGKPAIFVAFRDITESKRAEEELRKSDVRFRSLIQNSSDIIRIMDKEGRIIFDSPSSGKILGYPPGYTLGKFPFDFIHPDDLKLVRNELGTVYDKQNSGIPVEFRIRKADGEYLWVESIGVNMIGVPGVDGIVITTRPIGERKKAEEELKAAKMETDLYVDLMCHDISNMNQVGIGFLEMALDMLDLDDVGREMLWKPKSAFEKSSKLIDNVRKLQKARSSEYQYREMDIGKVLRKVQDSYSKQYGQSVTINYLMNPGYLVKANELLYDLFSNLVGNAIKHSKAHPIIDVNVEPMRENGCDYYMVTIDDQGPGIPDELKAIIFDRKLTGDIKSKGSGIGLFMVKTLVDRYDGRAWIEDRVKGDYTKGARFVIMLPAI